MRPSVLDTDILSEIGRGKNPLVGSRALEYVREYGRLAITFPTVVEVVAGHQRIGRQDRLDVFIASLRQVEILPIDLTAATLAGRMMGDLNRIGRPIGSFDPLIAAIAIVQERTLVTGNTEHYRRIVESGYPLQLDDWRQHTT